MIESVIGLAVCIRFQDFLDYAARPLQIPPINAEPEGTNLDMVAPCQNTCLFQRLLDQLLETSIPLPLDHGPQRLVSPLSESFALKNDGARPGQGFRLHRNGFVYFTPHLREGLARSVPEPHATALLISRNTLPTGFVILPEYVAVVAIEAESLLLSWIFDAAHTQSSQTPLRSTARATALPPPRQSAAMPRFRLRRCNS